MNLVRELSSLFIVDGVRVKQGAKRLEICLLLQQRDKVISVGGETGRNDFPDLPFNIVRLYKQQDGSVLKYSTQTILPIELIQKSTQKIFFAWGKNIIAVC